MLKQNNKGFSLIEVLVAKSIIFVLLATFIPLYTTILKEQAVLKDRLTITSTLHDELQLILWNNESMRGDMTRINSLPVHFTFTHEKRYIKGCASWQKKQETKEKKSLYGLEEK